MRVSKFKPSVRGQNTADVKEEVMPKRFKQCYVDGDTFVVRCAKLMQEDYVEVRHIKSGRMMEFRNKTSFGVRSEKIIELTEEDINNNKRTTDVEINKKKVIEPYKWLAWKNYDQEQKGGATFSIADFELLPKARLSSQYESYEDALNAAEMVFASNIKGVKDNMESEGYVLGISSGDGNYRNQESKTIGYKSSRLEKPIYFQEFKDKISQTYKNKIWWTSNNEAEDYLQHVAKQEEAKYGEDFNKWTICGTYIDKDVTQVYLPYKSFDDYEAGWVYPTKFECEKTLVAQTISGDPTDTIQGLPTLTESVTKHFGLRKANGVSKSTAEKLLIGCNTIQEMWQRAIYSYQQYYGFSKEYKFKDVHGEDQCWTWIDYMQQCYVLVKMQEYQDQIPCVRKYLESIGIDWTLEIEYGKVEIDTESLIENLEVCKSTLETLKVECKAYKSLKRGDLVDKMDAVVKIVSELEGNISMLEK